jgi:hypothetical protein
MSVSSTSSSNLRLSIDTPQPVNLPLESDKTSESKQKMRHAVKELFERKFNDDGEHYDNWLKKLPGITIINLKRPSTPRRINSRNVNHIFTKQRLSNPYLQENNELSPQPIPYAYVHVYKEPNGKLKIIVNDVPQRQRPKTDDSSSDSSVEDESIANEINSESLHDESVSSVEDKSVSDETDIKSVDDEKDVPQSPPSRSIKEKLKALILKVASFFSWIWNSICCCAKKKPPLNNDSPNVAPEITNSISSSTLYSGLDQSWSISSSSESAHVTFQKDSHDDSEEDTSAVNENALKIALANLSKVHLSFSDKAISDFHPRDDDVEILPEDIMDIKQDGNDMQIIYESDDDVKAETISNDDDLDDYDVSDSE